MKRLAVVATVALGLGLTALAQDRQEGRTFVLVVGVNDYADPMLTVMGYAVADALAFYGLYASVPRSRTTSDRVQRVLRCSGKVSSMWGGRSMAP